MHRVAEIRRYPVKSMQGEIVDEAVIGESGIIGDRAYALLDVESGTIASAKHPGRWAPLLNCRARFEAAPRDGEPLPPVEIELPDGTRVTSADSRVDEILSHALSRKVRLVCVSDGITGNARHFREADRSPLERLGSGELIRRERLAAAAPGGSFFDYAPLHIVSTSTLQALGVSYPEGAFDVRRFRPNIVVESQQSGFVENEWIGGSLAVGDCLLRVIDPCPRCVITTLAQGSLPRDPMIFKTIHRSNAATSHLASPGARLPAVVGVYAHAQQRGSIAKLDNVLPLPMLT